MIVRISTEGQYEVPHRDEDALGALDRRAVEACEVGDEQRFRDAFSGLLDFVRIKGRVVAPQELASSDLILPPPDISVWEARTEFSGEGLIPG